MTPPSSRCKATDFMDFRFCVILQGIQNIFEPPWKSHNLVGGPEVSISNQEY